MTPIKQIRQDKRQHRRKKMATRSRQKEIRERNGKHCAGDQPPGSTALEKHQNPKKRRNSIKKITCEGDQKSACPGFHCTTPPHRRARASIERKQRADDITTHTIDTNQ